MHTLVREETQCINTCMNHNLGLLQLCSVPRWRKKSLRTTEHIEIARLLPQQKCMTEASRRSSDLSTLLHSILITLPTNEVFNYDLWKTTNKQEEEL